MHGHAQQEPTQAGPGPAKANEAGHGQPGHVCPTHALHDTAAGLRTAFFLNVGFALVEVVGGYYTNSVAVMSDALHDMGDGFALGLAWGLEYWGRQPASGRYSYGLRRLSLLGAVVNAAVLLLGGVWVMAEAVPRLWAPEPPHAGGMAGLAVLGLAVNGYAAWRVLQSKELNSQVAGWHLLEDVLGWAAVLASAVVMLFVDAWILDPLLSIGVALFILYNVFGRLWSAVALFLQAAPGLLTADQASAEISLLDHVRGVHDLHLWSLDGQRHVLTLHVVVDPSLDRPAVQSLRRRISDLAQSWHVAHLTVEIEYASGDPSHCTA